MGIQETQTHKHWNYFLALEDDVSKLSRFLELTESNFTSFSLELARILFAAASEVDVVAKQVCSQLKPNTNATNINSYREEIVHAYPRIVAAQVSAPRYGLTFNPWEQWGKDNNPIWWKAYNNVKHHRHTHFAEASLKNALNAVAGLFLLILMLYREHGALGQLAPNVVIFRPNPPVTFDYQFYEPKNEGG